MAGFEVITYGRFWVITKVLGTSGLPVIGQEPGSMTQPDHPHFAEQDFRAALALDSGCRFSNQTAVLRRCPSDLVTDPTFTPERASKV